LLEGQPEPPRYFAMMKRLNKLGPKVLHGTPRVQHRPIQDLTRLLNRGARVIDTRAPEAYASAHVPGTINIPYGSSFVNWAGWLISYEQPFYLIAERHLVEQMAKDLSQIGLDDLDGYFEPPNLGGWQEAGLSLQSYQMATPRQVAQHIMADDVYVIDVRNQAEWEEERLPAARHIMLGYLEEHVEELPRDKPLVLHCRAGTRSAIGASLLQASGITGIINMVGGIRDWTADGLPVDQGI
ncbi:MAG: MBL fold metallo-hydrolase, partial [Anaerolineae bacterium]|nr:MBL fold metallo-hydrolase [Anaerolineae bacterium]